MKTSPQAYIYFFTLTVNLVSFSVGWSMVWATPVLPILLGRTNSHFNPLPYSLTTNQGQWVINLFHLGACFGPTVAGFFAVKLGPKMTLLIFSTPLIFANALIIFATTTEHFYVSRLLCGFGCGAMYTVVPMFVSEFSAVHCRGRLGCCMSIMMALAALLCYSIAGTLNIRTTGYFGLVPLLLFVSIFVIWVPESPHYYVAKKNTKAAEMALMQLRRKPQPEVAEELEFLSQTIQEDQSISELLKLANVRKALFTCLILIGFQQLSGLHAILAYLQFLFDKNKANVPVYLSLVILGLLQLVSVTITAIFVDKIGRKLFLLLSTAGCFTTLSVLAMHLFFSQNNYYNNNNLLWLVLTLIILFILCCNCGVGPLPWVLMSEVLPCNLKYQGSSCIATVALVLNFLMTITYPTVAKSVGNVACWRFSPFPASPKCCTSIIKCRRPRTRPWRTSRNCCLPKNGTTTARLSN